MSVNDSPQSKDQRRILILGCGYLGRFVVEKALSQGIATDALTRNSDTCIQLQKMGAQKTISQTLATSNWHSEIDPNHYQAVIVSVGSSESTPEGYRESYIDGLNSVIRWIGDQPLRLIYTSSISVYGSSDGDWIDEQTNPAPENWRGEIILQSEELLRSKIGDQAFICRLGGIYGPGRMRFLQKTWSPENQTEDDGYLNLIHAEDAAEALLEIAMRKPPPASNIFNLTDNTPHLRSEVYGKNDSPTAKPYYTRSNRNRHSANRRIDSSKIQAELDWIPKHLIKI